MGPRDLDPAAAQIRSRLDDLLLSEPSPERHFVHGNLAGNVLEKDGELVILDVSPYRRHRRYAAVIVIADAVLWHGANPSLATDFIADAMDRDLLGRALTFRLVADDLATDRSEHNSFAAYQEILVAIG